MGAKMAKGSWVCACWLSIMGTAACEPSWGDASYGDSCYTEQTCDIVNVYMSDYCADGTALEVYDEERARCVLEQLRDGKTGQVLIDMSGWPTCSLVHEAHIVPDRRAVVVEHKADDLALDIWKERALLRSEAEYQKCLDDGPAAYPACLANALVFVSGPPICDCDYCEQEANGAPP